MGQGKEGNEKDEGDRKAKRKMKVKEALQRLAMLEERRKACEENLFLKERLRQTLRSRNELFGEEIKKEKTV